MNIDSIFKRGIEKVTYRFDKRRVVFVNITLILLFFGSFGAIVVADTYYLTVLAISTTSLILLFYILHGYYPVIIVRVAMLYFQFVIFMHSSVLEPGLYIEYGYVVLAAGLPVLFRMKWSVFFLISSAILFYYPFLMLDIYEDYFEIGFVPGAILYLVMLTFVKETEFNEQHLIDKNKELVKLNKEKNSLIGVVAHDLKSPLNQIRGLISLINLSEDKLSADIKEYIARIYKSSEKMSEMIAEVLNTEVLDNKEIVVQLESISPAELMTEVAKDFELLANEKDIKIINQLQQKQELVLADRQGLLHVIQNLISNAIKFSPLHSQIGLSMQVMAHKIRLKVADNGPGITEEDQQKLFQKYQQLSAKPTGGEISTGLGLAIVKKFVDAMKGEVWCESKGENGATFVVELDRIVQN